MAQQTLDRRQIDARFEQMGGETMAQRVNAAPGRDAAFALCPVEDALRRTSR